LRRCRNENRTKYLERIDTGATADENIERLCFRSGGLLVDEFEEIFDDALDENQASRKNLLLSLASGEMSVSELSEMNGLELNGHISENLAAWEASGFVAKDEGLNPLSGKKAKEARYRICDNYTRFCLKNVIPALVYEGALSKRIEADGFFPRIVSAEMLLGIESAKC